MLGEEDREECTEGTLNYHSSWKTTSVHKTCSRDDAQGEKEIQIHSHFLSGKRHKDSGADGRL